LSSDVGDVIVRRSGFCSYEGDLDIVLRARRSRRGYLGPAEGRKGQQTLDEKKEKATENDELEIL
jgi:hypothetical protein